jgi:hypothetical protein
VNIQHYYQIIKEKLQSGNYTTSYPRDINPHLEAINYLQWEFMSDRKDPRIDKVFQMELIKKNLILIFQTIQLKNF